MVLVQICSRVKSVRFIPTTPAWEKHSPPAVTEKGARVSAFTHAVRVKICLQSLRIVLTTHTLINAPPQSARLTKAMNGNWNNVKSLKAVLIIETKLRNAGKGKERSHVLNLAFA